MLNVVSNCLLCFFITNQILLHENPSINTGLQVANTACSFTVVYFLLRPVLVAEKLIQTLALFASAIYSFIKKLPAVVGIKQ